MRRHIMIPDVQVTPDTPIDHLEWIGEYIVEMRPDVIIQIGDFADMESLSTYDAGKKSFEGRRYTKDIEASRRAMDLLLKPLKLHNKKMRLQKLRQYKPEMHLTLGNHEYRIERATEDDPKLDGILSISDLGYDDDWTVHDFLKPVTIDGVAYAHYFCNPMSGKPYGGQSIDSRLKNIGFSFTMGHQQHTLVGQRYLNNGTRVRGLVSGACYMHDEDYIGHQGNGYWRGIFVKNEVHNGEYDLMEVSLDYLCRKYEHCRLWEFMKKKHPDHFYRSTWMQYQERAA